MECKLGETGPYPFSTNYKTNIRTDIEKTPSSPQIGILFLGKEQLYIDINMTKMQTEALDSRDDEITHSPS
jgi:hypothetical protein